MIVTCRECRARFHLEDHVIQKQGTKVRCSKCRRVFRVYPDDALPEERRRSGLAELAADFQTALSRVLASADMLLNELNELDKAAGNRPPARGGGAENTGEKLPDALHKLEALLMQNDLEAEEYFKSVKGNFADHGFADQADHMEKLIRGFQFNAALAVLARISGAMKAS